MKDLNDLRQARSASATAMQTALESIETLESAATPDADALTAAQAVFDQAEADFKAADTAVKRAESVEAAQASAARGGDETVTAPAPSAPAQAARPEDKGIEVGFMVGALANSKGDMDKAIASLEKTGHGQVAAIMSGVTDGAGGFAVPEPLAQDIIDLLRPKVIVRRAGAQTGPIPAGRMRNARLATGATAAYAGETGAAVASAGTVDAVDLAFKKLMALVPISNDLLRQSPLAMARAARNDVVRQMAAREDIGFLRNDGTSGTVKGLKSWCLPANWEVEALKTVAAVEAFIDSRVNAVEDADVPMIAPGWAMRASTKNFLGGLRNPDTGYKVYPSIDTDGTLKGFPVYTSSQIPNNLGAGSDTEITFCDFSEIMIGDALNLRIQTSDQAAYVDTNGDTISALQRDLTLMVAISEHDLAPMHDAAISGGTVTGWSV